MDYIKKKLRGVGDDPERQLYKIMDLIREFAQDERRKNQREELAYKIDQWYSGTLDVQELVVLLLSVLRSTLRTSDEKTGSLEKLRNENLGLRTNIGSYSEMLRQKDHEIEKQIMKISKLESDQRGMMEDCRTRVQRIENAKAKLEHDMNEYYKEKIKKMEEDHEIALASLQSRLTEELVQAENEKRVLISRHQQELKNQDEKHDDHVQQLQEHIGILNTSLVTRDRFKSMPDYEMKDKFASLSGKISLLSKRDWNNNRTDWTPDILQQFSEDEKKGRILRRHILSDAIWIALLENIFASPFRVFGQAGRNLERDWSEKFGDSSTSGK